MAEQGKTSSDNENIPVPGLLRLPCEIRLQMYNQLLHGNRSDSSCMHNSFTPHKPILELAITQACRLLRNETLPIFYSNAYWLIESYDPTALEDIQSWLRDADPIILSSLKGIRLANLLDVCVCGCGLKRKRCSGAIVLNFSKDGIVTKELSGEYDCCFDPERCNQERLGLMDNFISNVKAQPERLWTEFM